MKDSDIVLIEQALGISLPESYKRAVVPFRIPALVGNTEHQLWDDANGLVELNRKLRVGSRYRPAWPEMIALDTRSAEGPVWWLDHRVVESKASYQSHSKFADWAEEFYRDMRSDLEGDGVDPDGKPQVPEPMSWRRLFRDLLSLTAVAVIGLIILFGIAWLRSWLKKH